MYVERKEVIKTIRDLFNEFIKTSEYESWDLFQTGRASGVIDVRLAVEDIPSADVVKVRRGHWIVQVGNHYEAKCSECGYSIRTKFTNYCPDCGAKMINN